MTFGESEVKLPDKRSSEHLEALDLLSENSDLPTATYVFGQLLIASVKPPSDHILKIYSNIYRSHPEMSQTTVKTLSSILKPSIDLNILYLHFEIVTCALSIQMICLLDSASVNESISKLSKSAEFMGLLSLYTRQFDQILNSSSKFLIKSAKKSLANLLTSGQKLSRIECVLECVLKSTGFEQKNHINQTLIIGNCVDLSFLVNVVDAPLMLAKYTNPIFKIVIEIMVTSKKQVESIYINSLGKFYNHFLDVKLYQEKKLANFEKWLLRSPEVVIKGTSIFNKVINEITRHVSFDVGAFFSSKFASLLLQQLKSKNPQIREDAMEFYETLVLKSIGRKSLIDVTLLILAEFNNKPLVEYRGYLYTALNLLSCGPTVSVTITGALPLLISKETLENLIRLGVNAFKKHFQTLLLNGKKSEQEKCFEAVIAGISDSNMYARKSFLYAIGDLLSLESIVAIKQLNIDLLRSKLWEIAHGIQKSASLIVDSKKETVTLIEGLLAVRIILKLRQLDSETTSASLEQLSTFLAAKDSFVFNQKLFSVYLQEDCDQLVFAEILADILRLEDLATCCSTVDSIDCFSNAIVWCQIRANGKTRLDFSMMITKIVQNNSQLLQLLTRISRLAIGEILAAEYAISNLSIKDEVRSDKKVAQRMLRVLYAILPTTTSNPAEADQVRKSLAELFIICSHPVMTDCHGSDLWIRICFRSDIQPNFVTSDIIAGWLSNKNHQTLGGVSMKYSHGFRQATLAAISLSTQLCCKIAVPVCLDWVMNRASKIEFEEFGKDDLLIWKTNPLELFNHPIASQKSHVAKSQFKNDDEKWEYDLNLKRQKQYQPTKKELGLINDAFKAEAIIRLGVQCFADTLLSSLDVLEYILDGTSSSGDEMCIALHMHDISNWLLDILHRESCVFDNNKKRDSHGAIAGDRPISVLMKLAETVFKSRIDAKRHINLVLYARGIDADMIPKKYTYGFDGLLLDYFNELISDTENNLLPPQSFTLLCPIIFSVIERGGRISTVSKKSYTEILLLASDILMNHSAIQGPTSIDIPRKEMLLKLLELLEFYPLLRVSAQTSILALAMTSSSLEDDFEAEPDKLIQQRIKDVQGGVYQVLIDGIMSNESHVSLACIEALTYLPSLELVHDFGVNVWIARSDQDEKLSGEADRLWEQFYGKSSLDISESIAIRQHILHDNETVRLNAGKALCVCLSAHEKFIPSNLDSIYETYNSLIADSGPELDEYGLPVLDSKPDDSHQRAGIAGALRSCVSLITTKAQTVAFFEFCITNKALGDESEPVRSILLEAGLDLLKKSGDSIRELLDLFDTYLEAKSNGLDDHIREAVVILLGTLAAQLESTDERIPIVIASLIDSLKTPSESVQHAVSLCLPALVKITKNIADRWFVRLMDQLFNAPKYGDRRGAAYGLAGVVKGCGYGSLKNYSIMIQLKVALEDKKNIPRREGALFAFEMLSLSLGRVFEPCVIEILPLLLVSFGDAHAEVRDATRETCRVIMSSLSGYCVTLLLPSLLDGLQDRQWRTQTSSIEVIASMSSLAPAQLSDSLPILVPKICSALSDSHQKVQNHAKEALFSFGKVIKNPEIAAQVPILIAALVDPNTNTLVALAALLETTFVHYIDTASLAILVPIIHRGMIERSAEIKRKSARIFGNMASLTESRDLTPYMGILLPCLKQVLIDPVPDTRTTAAKAFGTLVSKMGEKSFPDLIDEFMDILASDISNVDRSGAAQAVSEILFGIGMRKLDEVLPAVLERTYSTQPFVREGFIILLSYLPVTFGEDFVPYIPKIIPTILEGLADTFETVREAALKVGQVIIQNYTKLSVEILLPHLESGLFNENWRIRLSSIKLMSGLLFKICGISSVVQDESAETDEGEATETQRMALRNALGDEWYDKVLSSIFIIKGDSASLVRDHAQHVWRSIVSNTPRTLKEILPVLTELLLSALASVSAEKQAIATRTLDDLCQKLGDSIVTDVVPLLEKGMYSSDDRIRQGSCVGMTQIISSCGRTSELFLMRCVPLVKAALVDINPDVRGSAAMCLGSRAIDDIIPPILAELKSDSRGVALAGLKEIMATKGNFVFPVLIPTLLASPMNFFRVKALGSLIAVAGGQNRRLPMILSEFIKELVLGTEITAEIYEVIEILFKTIEGEGIEIMMELLQDKILEVRMKQQTVALRCLALFFGSSNENIEDFVNDWIKVLSAMLGGPDLSDPAVERATEALAAMDALLKRTRKEDLDKYILALLYGISQSSYGLEEESDIIAFTLPNGLSPILPILLYGLLNGEHNIREKASRGLAMIISRTPEARLKPYVTQITGPLIRVIGDRFPSNVKNAILSTLSLLLRKCAPSLKPFLPQLQRSFCKSLGDPQGTVESRIETSRCIDLLIPLLARLDPLLVELSQTLKASDDVQISVLIWKSIANLLGAAKFGGGKELGATSVTKLREMYSQTLSKCLDDLPPEDLEPILNMQRICSASFPVFLMTMDESSAATIVAEFVVFVDVSSPANNNEWSIHSWLLIMAHLDEEFGTSGIESIKYALNSQSLVLQAAALELLLRLVATNKRALLILSVTRNLTQLLGSSESTFIKIKILLIIIGMDFSELDEQTFIETFKMVIEAVMGCTRLRIAALKHKSDECLRVLMRGENGGWDSTRMALAAIETQEYINRVLLE